MGPTQVDPLTHARSIVRQCVKRDTCTRAFGRNHEGLWVEASSSEFVFSSGEGVPKPTDLSTKVQTALIFVLLCAVVIIVALIASSALSVNH